VVEDASGTESDVSSPSLVRRGLGIITVLVLLFAVLGIGALCVQILCAGPIARAIICGWTGVLPE
jgi:hypothetical protein